MRAAAAEERIVGHDRLHVQPDATEHLSRPLQPVIAMRQACSAVPRQTNSRWRKLLHPGRIDRRLMAEHETTQIDGAARFAGSVPVAVGYSG